MCRGVACCGVRMWGVGGWGVGGVPSFFFFWSCLTNQITPVHAHTNPKTNTINNTTTKQTSREAKVGEIQSALDEFMQARSRADERFQTVVGEELSLLKAEVAREAQARVREDDEIIEALGRYTSKLQLSLKIINAAHDV